MSKARIIKLLKILQDKTDPDHVLNSEQLITMLNEQGEDVERKTIYSDIRSLQNAGYQIESVRDGRNSGYYYDDLKLDGSELRVLADAVLSNNFITDRKSDELLNKLLAMTNEHERKVIEKTLTYRHDKTGNEQILYNIDALQKALYEHEAISFAYFDRNIRREKSYRKKGQRYHTIPYALIWNQDRYYLIGYSESHDDFTHYRVDRMERIETEKTDHQFRPFDVSGYVSRVFEMYRGQDEVVKLRCEQKLAQEVSDQFGDSMIVTAENDSHFEISVRVQRSPVFYSWLFKYGNQIEIVSPESVRREYGEMCREVMERYGQL